LNELIKRSLTGLLFILAVIGSVYIHLLVFGAVFLFFSFFALKEFFQLNKGINRSSVVSGLILGTGIFLLVLMHYLFGPVPLFLIFISLALFYIPILLIFTPGITLMRNISITYFGLFYTILPFTLLFLLLPGTYDTQLYTGFFILLWSYDTGAYVSGRLLGRNKMAPALSPGKTWEGFAGGAVIAAVACYFVSKYFAIIVRLDWYIILIIIIIMGTLGDLFESRLKRKAGVKDSGKILPGHGGVLDRFDSVFFSVPAVVLFYVIRYILV